MQEPRISILVVDDERVIHESCGRILREEGYEVDAALNGREALQKLKERRYNLVLSDIKMPGIDGVETLELMKREFPDIMVVMFTGFSSVETARSSMKLGAFDYLPKPYTPGELLAVVASAGAHIRGRRRSSLGSARRSPYRPHRSASVSTGAGAGCRARSRHARAALGRGRARQDVFRRD